MCFSPATSKQTNNTSTSVLSSCSPNTKSTIKFALQNSPHSGIPNAQDCDATLRSKELAEQVPAFAGPCVAAYHAPNVLVLNMLGHGPKQSQKLEKHIPYGFQLSETTSPVAPAWFSGAQVLQPCTVRAMLTKPWLHEEALQGRWCQEPDRKPQQVEQKVHPWPSLVTEHGLVASQGVFSWRHCSLGVSSTCL